MTSRGMGSCFLIERSALLSLFSIEYVLGDEELAVGSILHVGVILCAETQSNPEEERD